MGAGTSAASGCEAHAGAQAATAQPNATGKAVLPQPVQAVFSGYIQVQTALAADSLPGFPPRPTSWRLAGVPRFSNLCSGRCCKRKCDQAAHGE